LVTTVISGFLLDRIKNYRVMRFGTSIATVGFFLLVMFHATETSVMAGLAVLAVGLSLSIAGGFNVILVSVPMKVTGIALGMAMLLNLVGMSVGPVFAGVFQDTYSETIEGMSGTFPTKTAYLAIFVSSTLISLASVVLSIMINKRKTSMQQ